MIVRDSIVHHVAEILAARCAVRDFADVDVRRLSGSLHDIKERVDAVLEKLDDIQFDEDGRHTTLAEARDIELDNETSVGYNLDMIKQSTGAFQRYMM